MAEKVNHTLRVLREIRERLDAHERRFESIEARVGLLVEGQTQLTTEVIGVGEAVREVATLLRTRLDDRARIDDHEHRLSALERKVG